MEFKPEIEIQISNKNEGGRNQGGFKTSLEEIFLKQLYIIGRKEANTLLKQMPQQKSPMYFYLKYFYSF